MAELIPCIVLLFSGNILMARGSPCSSLTWTKYHPLQHHQAYLQCLHVNYPQIAQVGWLSSQLIRWISGGVTNKKHKDLWKIRNSVWPPIPPMIQKFLNFRLFSEYWSPSPSLDWIKTFLEAIASLEVTFSVRKTQSHSHFLLSIHCSFLTLS